MELGPLAPATNSLFVLDGISGFPMACVLRAGNTHASHRAKAVLKRLIRKLKKAYPGAEILLRADADWADAKSFNIRL
jgi:hypothetical protein